MRLIELLALPVTLVPVLAPLAAYAAAPAPPPTVVLTNNPGLYQSPPDVIYTAPAGEQADGHVHIESHGCRIISDGDAWVDFGASPATLSSQLSATCSVTVTASQCRMRSGVDYTLEAEHLFFFDAAFGGAAPDEALLIEALISTFGHDTAVTFDSSTDYGAVYPVPLPPPPSKKQPAFAVATLPIWVMGLAVDQITLTNSMGQFTYPGVPSFVTKGSGLQEIEIANVNVADPKEVHRFAQLDDSLPCGGSRTYTATTSVAVDMSADAFDDLYADLSYLAVADVRFSAWVR